MPTLTFESQEHLYKNRVEQLQLGAEATPSPNPSPSPNAITLNLTLTSILAETET